VGENWGKLNGGIMISPVLMLGGKSLSHSFYNGTLATYALCFSGGCWGAFKKEVQAFKSTTNQVH
jgi:hypothetical protein